MKSGLLTCRLTVLRAGAAADDGLQTVPGAVAALDQRPWAMRRDVSDGEVVRAGMVLGSKVSRFTVKRTAFTRAIVISDQVKADGLRYDIVGIKEMADRDIELTAVARV